MSHNVAWFLKSCTEYITCDVLYICQEIPAEERIKLKSTPLPVKLSDFIQVKMPNGPLQSLTFNHGDGCIIRFQDCSGNVQG